MFGSPAPAPGDAAPHVEMAASPSATLWPELSALFSRLEELRSHRTSRFAASLSEARLRAAEAALDKLAKAIASERACLTQSDGDASDDDFWARYAELEADEAAAVARLHSLKATRYFPTASYRLGVPGLYVGMADFWISQLSANFEVQCSPAAGDVWTLPGSGLPLAGGSVPGAPRPASVLLRLRPLTLALQIDDLGLRGDSVPSPLRSIRQLQLSLDLDVCVPLLFAPPPRTAGSTAAAASAVGVAAAAASTSGAVRAGTATAGQSPLDRLLTFRWQAAPAPAFRCEVTRLECRTKGLSIPLPNTLLRWAVNALVPSRLRDALTAAVPQELGILLSLHRSGDHAFRCAGRAGVFSLPLDALSAPLEAAVDVRPALWTLSTPTLSPAQAPSAASSAGVGAAAPQQASGSSSSRRSSLCEGSTPGAAPVSERLRPRSRAYHAGRGGSPRRAAAGLSGALRASLAQAAAAPGEQPQVWVAAAPPGSYGAPLSLPQLHATWGSASLGLTAQQARCFIAAQTGAAVAAGAKPLPLLKSAHDLMRFVALHSPQSRARAMQEEAQVEAAAALAEAETLAAAFLAPAATGPTTAAGGSGGATGGSSFASWWGGTSSSGTGASSTASSSAPTVSSPLAPQAPVATHASASAVDAEATAYARALAALQALLDTHVDAQAGALLARGAAAAVAGDKAEARRLAGAAASVAEHSAVDARALSAAAERLNLKPLRLHVKVAELSAATHAQTAVGLVKTVLLRLLQERRDRVLGSAGRNGGALRGGSGVVGGPGGGSGSSGMLTRGPPSPSSQRISVLSARSAAAAKAASTAAAAATKAAAGKAAAGLQAGARAMGTSLAAGLRKGSAASAGPSGQAPSDASFSLGGSHYENAAASAPMGSASSVDSVSSGAPVAAAAGKKGGFFSSLWGSSNSASGSHPAASSGSSTAAASVPSAASAQFSMGAPSAATASSAALPPLASSVSPGPLSPPPEGVTALSLAAFAAAPAAAPAPAVPARSDSLSAAAAEGKTAAMVPADPSRSTSLCAAAAPASSGVSAALPADVAAGASRAKQQLSLSAEDISAIAAEAADALAVMPAGARSSAGASTALSAPSLAAGASAGASAAAGAAAPAIRGASTTSPIPVLSTGSGDDASAGSAASQPLAERRSRSSFGSIGAASAATPAALGAAASSGGSTAGAAAAGASLAAQAERVQDWAADSAASAAAVISLVSRVSASICASVTGGTRGQLAGAVRQLQLEMQPGMRMPVPLPEGVFPPSAMVTAFETADERSEALGWRRNQPVLPASADGRLGSGGGLGGGGGGNGRSPGFGMLSMMLAFPRDPEPGAPVASAAAAAPGTETAENVRNSQSAASHGDSGRLSSASEVLPVRRESSIGSIASLLPPASSSSHAARHLSASGDDTVAIQGTAGADATASTTASTKPLALAATLRVHRLWAGLRVDEDALLELLLRRRAIAAASYRFNAARAPGSMSPPLHLPFHALVDGRYTLPPHMMTPSGMPATPLPPLAPLHVMELDLRPVAAAGSHGPGLDAAAVERLTAQRPERQLAALRAGRAGLAGDGSIGILGEPGGDVMAAVHTGISDAPELPALPPAAPYAVSVETAPWTRFCAEAAALEARGELDTVIEQLRSMVSGLWQAARAEQARGERAGSASSADGASAEEEPAEDADAAAAAAGKTRAKGASPAAAAPLPLVADAVSRMRRYLDSEQLHLTTNIVLFAAAAEPLALPKHSAAASGIGSPTRAKAEATLPEPDARICDVAGIAAGVDATAADADSSARQVQRRRDGSLFLSVSSIGASPSPVAQPFQPSIIPAPGSAAQAAQAVQALEPVGEAAKVAPAAPATADALSAQPPMDARAAVPSFVESSAVAAAPIVKSSAAPGEPVSAVAPADHDAGADANPFGWTPSPTAASASAPAPTLTARSGAGSMAAVSAPSAASAASADLLTDGSSRSRAASAATSAPDSTGASIAAARPPSSSVTTAAGITAAAVTAALPPRAPLPQTLASAGGSSTSASSHASAGSAATPAHGGAGAVAASAAGSSVPSTGHPDGTVALAAAADSLPPLMAPALSLDLEVQLLQLLDDWQAVSRMLAGSA